MKNYLFIDYATQGYIVLVGLLIALCHNATVPHWPWLLAGHAAAFGLVHLLVCSHAHSPQNRIIYFLRHYYPILLYTAFYRETGALNRMFFPNYLDANFIKLDQHLFGFQPCLAFMDSLPWLAVSELFYASYFSYYLMITGVGLALLWRSRRQFFHYVSVVSFVFYVCYVTYIILPVMGPRAFYREIDGFRLPPAVEALGNSKGNSEATAPAAGFRREPFGGYESYPTAVRAGVFFKLMAWIYRNFEGPGAAFPSSHVAVALTTVWFSFLYLPRICWLHLSVAILLCGATVYCRYHYVVDVMAGIATVLILVPLGTRLYVRFGEDPRRESPTQS